jgi:hypothetical protein
MLTSVISFLGHCEQASGVWPRATRLWASRQPYGGAGAALTYPERFPSPASPATIQSILLPEYASSLLKSFR